MACTADTTSIDLDVDVGVLTAELIVDPAAAVAGVAVAPNGLLVDAVGVYVNTDGWTPLPGALAYSSADGHTYVATASLDYRAFLCPGDRLRLTQSATVAYYIVTAVAAASVTLYGGTDYVLANSGISAVSFSKEKSPVGFPLSPPKWTEELGSTANNAQAPPVAGTWYNPGSLSLAVPIGSWWLSSAVLVSCVGSTNPNVYSTLSTANNSESDPDFTTYFENDGSASGFFCGGRTKALLLAAKTTYFLNIKTANGGATNVSIRGDVAKIILRAVCAYL